MRVLLLHNRYRAAGGEERAVAEITALLARRGHAAELFERSSADIGPARAARGLLSGGIAWNASMWGHATLSVTAVEMVTAEGRLITANAHQNHEMFWVPWDGHPNAAAHAKFAAILADKILPQLPEQAARSRP